MISCRRHFPTAVSAWRWLCLLLLALCLLPASATTLIGVTTQNTGSGSKSSSISIPVPTGTLSGHFMLAQVTMQGGAGITITPPTGWAFLRRTNGSDLTQAVYYRVATAAEPASYTWTIAPDERISGGMITWANVDVSGGAAAAILAHNGQANASSSTVTTPSITTVSPTTNARIIGLFSTANGNGAATPPAVNTTYSGGLTHGYEVGSGAGPNGVTLAFAHRVQATAGATGSHTATMTVSASNIGSLIALKSAAVPAINNFLINIGAGTASTCSPRNIQITARDASNNTLTSYTGTVNISVSSAHGDWSKVSANGTLTQSVANSGAATYQFVAADNGVITLNLSNQHADDLTITVVDNAVASTSSTSATLSFRDNAFVITPDPIQVAGRNQAMSLAMWRRDLSTGDCAIATAYTGNRNLKAWISRDAADPNGTAPSIGATSLPNAVPGANNLSLNFTAGVANFNLSTTDVGKYALNLRDDSRSFATGVDINGGSSTLTVRPFGIRITNIRRGATVNPGGTAATDAVFTRAGLTFEATIGGYLWQAADDANNDGIPDGGSNITDNGLAPRFAWPTALASTLPITPVGGVLGSLGGTTSIAQASYSGGSATVNNLTYDEVGSVTLQASFANYLNTAGVNQVTTSSPVGRFTPNHFDISVNTPQFTTACTAGGFTYIGQPFGYTTAPVMTVTARAAAGTTTQNYAGAFWKITNTSLTGRNYTAATGTLDVGGLPGTASDPAIVSSGNGVGTLTFSAGSGLAFTRTAPVLPFDAEIRLAINVIDTDGVTHTANPAGFGAATPGNGIAFSAGKAMRFGRLYMSGAYGSELLPLPINLSAEYWDDLDGAGPGTEAGFIRNTADSCTAVGAAAVTLTAVSGPLTTADTTLSVAASPFVAGSWHSSPSGPYSQLSAPGAGKTGSLDLTVNLAAAGLPWLGDDLDGDTNYNDNPTARAVFGIYQQPSSIIFRREVY